MKNSTASRIFLSLFLIGSSTTFVHSITFETPESYLKAHRALAIALSAAVAAGYAAKPPKKAEPGLLTDLRKAFGWRKKEGKWKKVDGEVVFDPGYEEQGLVGVVSNCGNAAVTLASLMVILKALEPIVKWGELVGLYDLGKPAKA